jgi:alanyl aminopeptidase
MPWIRAIALCLLWTGSVPAQGPAPQFRLPGDVVPKKYKIELTIDPRQEVFSGWARIEVRVRKPVDVIWLNATDLTVQEASVRAGGRTSPAKATAAGGEFLRLELGKAARPGAALLSIRYRGSLNEKPMLGPYRVNFENQWYVFTSFTAIEARRAFPCFDEPRYKTPWEFTIRVPTEDKAFANAREVSERSEPGGMKAVHFARTAPLPSEVVAFAVGPLERLEGGRAGRHRVPIGVVTPRGHAAEGQEAVRATGEVLKRLEAYTGIPYPYDKLDHLAAPRFPFGATENPGLIIYGPRPLLFPPGKETPEQKRLVRSVMTHETSHQWFGDLVTQASWQEVWLSEGMATWLTNRILDQDQPATRKNLAAVAARERIMTADAGPRTRPVRLEMKDRAGMKDVYSQFVYQKAGAVLLMLENWLGEARFQQGLRAYLHEHRFGNATTDDLAADLRKASGQDPSAVMHSFLDQTGIPSVGAELRCQTGVAPRVLLEQTNTTAQWTMPVCWKAEGAAAACELLKPSVAQPQAVTGAQRRQVELRKATACPAWIYLNAGGAGYYRTDWTAGQLAALVNHGLAQLGAAERLTLVYDVGAELRAGKLDVAAAQPILAKLAADKEPEIARAATEALTPPKQ